MEKEDVFVFYLLPKLQEAETTFSSLLTYHVWKNEIPTSYKRPEFSDSHVAVQVGRASLGHTCSKLSIAQASHDWSEGSNEEGHHNTGPGIAFRHLSRQHVDASAQRASHAEGDQVDGGQAAAKLGFLQGVHVHYFPPHQGAAKR